MYVDKCLSCMYPVLSFWIWYIFNLFIYDLLSYKVFSSLNPCLVTGTEDGADGSDCFDGSDSTCPAGTIYNDLNLTTEQAQLATSLVIVGAWLGSLLGSIPSERYGRRLTLLGNNSFFIVGAALSAIGDLNALFVGRLVSGLGVGAGNET